MHWSKNEVLIDILYQNSRNCTGQHESYLRFVLRAEDKINPSRSKPTKIPLLLYSNLRTQKSSLYVYVCYPIIWINKTNSRNVPRSWQGPPGPLPVSGRWNSWTAFFRWGFWAWTRVFSDWCSTLIFPLYKMLFMNRLEFSCFAFFKRIF
jgi:hypothetical protein